MVNPESEVNVAAGPVAGRPGWLLRIGRAAGFALDDGAAATALLGFLVRGGILLLLLPSVVLPSVINIAGFTGVDAISIAGQPTTWLVTVVVLAIVVALALVVVAALAGSIVDVWLVRMAMELPAPTGSAPERARRLEVPPASLVAGLAAIRIVCLAPLALAIGWAATEIYTATYDELTTPTNLVTPLPIRVIVAATGAVAVVLVVWLACETVAAIAVRRQILDRRGVPAAFVGAFRQIVRRPVTTLLTAVVSTGLSGLVLGLALLVTATAFDWCRVVARTPYPVNLLGGTEELQAPIFALAGLALALAWVVALSVAAATSAWRSAAFTAEAIEATLGPTLSAPRHSQPEPAGLPGEGPRPFAG